MACGHPINRLFHKSKHDWLEEVKEKLLEKYDSQLTKQKNLTFSNSNATRNLTTGRYYNRPNGVYLLSVSAVDEVGNISEPSKSLYILNKFQPSTYVTAIEQQKNDMGDSQLVINGGGFTYDGTVREIYIDADGKAPYDLTLTSAEGKFRIFI